MAKDFIRVTTCTEIPTAKDAQMRIILEGAVYEAVYRKFMSTAPIARLTDYGSFFSVTFADLVDYLKTHPAELERVLPWDRGGYQGEGISILRKPGGAYELRGRDRGWTTLREEARDLPSLIDKWLRRHLENQGLRSLIPKT